MEFILYFALSGSIAILLSKYTFERTKMIIVGVGIFASNFLLILSIDIFFNKSISQGFMINAIIGVSAGLLSLLISIGSLPIWEGAFDIVTPVKLLDLTSPSNHMLRKLTMEAPGTYHHSLIVANLSEQAAYDIGANAPLARVGGYYHDIGKLKYPYCFSENQVGSNSHDFLDPYDSAQLIMQHIPTGVDMADAEKLPRAIKDIIIQHHGTTLVKYFYHKAKETYPERKIEAEEFRYKGVIPKSRESAVVMLADTAEAAVRSMISSSKSMQEVEEFIGVLIKEKLNDSQLDDSSLTISDLVTIRKAFVKVFNGMYHERVKYPGVKTEDSDGEPEDE
jgi:putative nucleotidyltransferase with HDIG domain